jgi:hypothetical protein
MSMTTRCVRTLAEEGLFRVSGNKKDMTTLAAKYKDGITVNLGTECLDPTTVCGPVTIISADGALALPQTRHG